MSPATFFKILFYLSIVVWILFTYGSKLLAIILDKALGASIGLRINGLKGLRDVAVKFKKGPIESIHISEIRLSLRQSLVDPKLQLLICGPEIVTRTSTKSKKKSTQKPKTQKSGTSRKKGKWIMIGGNVAKFLSVTVTDLIVKTPKATLELKEFTVDISKYGGNKPSIVVKLQLLLILVHLGESRFSSDQALNDISTSERTNASFSCAKFSLLTEIGHDSEAGLELKNLEIANGNIALNLNDELLSRKKSTTEAIPNVNEVAKESSEAKKEGKKSFSDISKHASMIPEKFSFTLSKLDVKFVHREHGITVDNNITGFSLKSKSSKVNEALGETTKLNIQLELREIHLLREASTSVVEIMKFAVISTAYIPLQPSNPIRIDVDVKLGGILCNLIITRFIPLMKLRPTKKKKTEENTTSTPEKSKSTENKNLMWKSTISVPEITMVVYSLSGSPVYHCCLQSSNGNANNTSSNGTTAQMELGEFNLQMSDEYQECPKQNPSDTETNSDSLIHVAKINLDLGKTDRNAPDVSLRDKKVFTVAVAGMSICLTFKRLESLIATAFSYKSVLKSSSSSSSSVKKPSAPKSSKPSGKGIQHVKFNLERCSLNIDGEVGLENTTIADPKRVNYGSQGGRVLISVCPDGTPRTATICSTASDECKRLKYSASLEIYHLILFMNKEKQSTQMDLERARSVFQEFLEDGSVGSKITLLDMQNAKFVRRSGGVKESAVCSLFSATDISVRWEPDVQIALVELGLRMKLLVQNQKLQGLNNQQNLSSVRVEEPKKESLPPTGQLEKQQHKKKESIFAIDVEVLRISAEVGDGVEAIIEVQSIFSENARIGVLLEGMFVDLNGARIIKSSRMQMSRVPNAINNAKPEVATTVWDWVIRALDVQICLPYRVQLRAIDDSIEDMLRALKIITSAKTQLICPPVNKGPTKPKKPSSSKIGCVRVCVRKLAIDLEEEPIQGWLDEHYHLIKKEARELAVRLNFLDELISKNGQSDEKKDSTLENDNDQRDNNKTSEFEKLREDIYKQSFRSYYQACQKLVPAEGSGACKEGFQSGFKPSINRATLFSISATELDVSLTKIEGGDAGMIEVLQKLDPVCRAHNIPFARLYGGNIKLKTGSLAVKVRNYTYPLFAGTSGTSEGRLVLAQQATSFQTQMSQNVYVGKWRKVQMFRSLTGTTPPMKTFFDLPLHFQKGDIGFGVGVEPSFTDLSYVFTCALRRANLSVRNPNPDIPPPKKEKSLPWWDEIRGYIHGHIGLCFAETELNILATTDPYEKSDKVQILTGQMDIKQSDGHIYASVKDFKVFLSSLGSLLKNSSLKLPSEFPIVFLQTPMLTVDTIMEWECDSGNPLNHYLFALPSEGKSREIVFDPYRSTALSLQFTISLGPTLSSSENVGDSPMINLGPHDLAWLIKFWNMLYLPPQKLRTFSRWPRYGVPRIPRSGNLSLDKVMTEMMFRIEAAPTCIKHVPLDDDDPSKGVTINMTKLKYEMCSSRGKQKFTFETFRDPLDMVYQGVDLHMPKIFINREDCTSIAEVLQINKKPPQSASTEDMGSPMSGNEKHRDDGFIFSSEYFSLRKQSPKADPDRILSWQEAGRQNAEITRVRSENENASDDDEKVDPDDDDSNAVIADSCQRITVNGLKILWNLENRDAVWSWGGGLAKAFAPSKPSPSRQYTQRKLLEEKKLLDEPQIIQDDNEKLTDDANIADSSDTQLVDSSISQTSPKNVPTVERALSITTPSNTAKVEDASSVTSPKMDIPSFSAMAKQEHFDDSEEDGTRHFMVNVTEPQFNLHSEEANGRFLLAAVSGRVLARSFHSILKVGHEVIRQALGTENVQIPESQPEMIWSRTELSVMLEHVQAHVAPTDVDPGAGIQWLPKIHKDSPRVKRTGALLERVFMPCDMFFRYTRHKGGTPDLKLKPLKELTFNSHNITASMTARQFQVMLDVLTNLLFARAPKPRKSRLLSQAEDEEDVEEEADEVVPDGVEEVELAKVELEQKERVQKIILDDIRILSLSIDLSSDPHPDIEDELLIITGDRSILVMKLKKELTNARKSKKAASASLRIALQIAAQQRLAEKEKNKSPSYAMRLVLKMNKVMWGMLVDGKPFAEAEINDMIYDFDRDYKDIGVVKFTIKYFVMRNFLPNAKSDMLLCAWNPPSEWGKKVMLRVDAKQGPPKDGLSTIELLEAEIYPLKIHLTETMYRKMWGYLFPEEEQDSQRRQEVWKVSTTGGLKQRGKKGSAVQEGSTSSKGSDATNKLSDEKASKPKKGNNVSGELRRSSSFDNRTWEEHIAVSAADEILQNPVSIISLTKTPSLTRSDLVDEPTKGGKSKDLKLKNGRPTNEDKKLVKSDEKKPKRLREFHNIKICQVELSITYEGSRFVVSDLRLLMDTFHRVEFIGTWRRLFSRVKKHVIWGVVKSVTGIQMKKFNKASTSGPSGDLFLSEKGDNNEDGAGDGFVTSVKGLFSSQRRKAKAFVLKKMRNEDDSEQHGSEGEAEFSPLARQLSSKNAKKLIRRHTKKFHTKGSKASFTSQDLDDSLPFSPMELMYDSDSSSESIPEIEFIE